MKKRKYTRKQCSNCIYYQHDPNTDRPNRGILANLDSNPELRRKWPEGIRRGGSCRVPYDKEPVGGGGPVDWGDYCERYTAIESQEN